ncbi:MAG: Arylsulfatase [candidate division BRC1 bacterium ADurb.BinA364]|nr:MAG: Arylsulfatase [candidate division BRC1 bacterium ADurb.BinA364]
MKSTEWSSESRLSRRAFLKSASLATAALGIGMSAGADNAARRPDILFIMSDDHCANAIGAYGSRLAALDPTPTLDSLAREGMLFENCFCVNSICSPSRATILTGQHSQANGVLVLEQPLPPERQYLPTLMGQAGYETALIGKWHLREEPAAFEYYKVLPGQGRYFDPIFHESTRGAYPNNRIEEKGHSSDVMADSAIAWLAGRTSEKPFFLCLHFKAAHGPWQNAPRYDSWLEDVEVPYPDNLFETGGHGSIATRGDGDELARYIGTSIGLRHPLRNMAGQLEIEAAGGEESTLKAAYQLYLKRYLRCIRGIDDNVKRVLDYLRESGRLDSTLIVYTSDQGMFLGEHDYFDKRWMYEESMRMPLIVRYPRGVAAGARSDALIDNTDFAPTLLDFAEAEAPGFMHGRSFRPILESGEEPEGWRDAVYYRYWMHLDSHYNPAHFGVRTKRFKLIFFYGSGYKAEGVRTPPGWELYDLEADPFEMNNVYGRPEYAEIAESLKRRMLELREQLNETDAAYPRIQAIIDRHWTTTPESVAEAVEISHAAKRQFDQEAEAAGSPRKSAPRGQSANSAANPE